MTKITQAMILSAGKGTRMRPLTLTTPKPLLDVGGKPLIIWHIHALKKAGITDITINCSWLADKLIDALGDGSQFGVNLHWSIEKGEPLETAGGIAKALAENKLRQENFILINGDVWTTFDFAKLVDFQLADDMLAHLILIDNPPHNPTGDFILQNGLAKEKVSEEIKREEQSYTFAGISVINPKLLENIKINQAYPLAPLLKNAMKNNKISAEYMIEKWVDVGTPERLTSLDYYIRKQHKI
ncbi:MAG: nucleotidyltransferase family protein [Moraxellaceae bacterium]|nr:nucleotidyltransferase family protein [Moraxellaceae bacterium]